MKQKDDIELVIRSSQPACLCEGLFCFVKLPCVCSSRASVCLSASPLSHAQAPNDGKCSRVFARPCFSKTTTHPGMARFVGFCGRNKL